MTERGHTHVLRAALDRWRQPSHRPTQTATAPDSASRQLASDEPTVNAVQLYHTLPHRQTRRRPIGIRPRYRAYEGAPGASGSAMLQPAGPTSGLTNGPSGDATRNSGRQQHGGPDAVDSLEKSVEAAVIACLRHQTTAYDDMRIHA